MTDHQTPASTERLPKLSVETIYGTVVGALTQAPDGRPVRVFKGMPYAAAPVGPLRWRPPQRPASWSGVRSADTFACDCPSPVKPFQQSRAPGYSEDCLYVNVWAPRDASVGSLPVMVWIPGGGFLQGGGAATNQDGAALASEGVVVVSFNYRVGLFGYLAHPGLSAESEHGVSGNYGLLDQIAALEWVRDNIAAFGGDPSRVTAFGCSAGSASLALLMTSPHGAGLFQQAILESPGAGRPLATLGDAEVAGAALGPDIQALRELSTEELLKKTSLLIPKMRSLTGSRVLRPICDGWLIREDERHMIKTGQLRQMPMIVGSNAQEGRRATAAWPIETTAQYDDLLEKSFESQAAQARRLYPAASNSEVRQAVADLYGDTQFNYGPWLLASAMAAQTGAVWRYVFTRQRPKQPFGPDHTDENAYVFGNLNAWEPAHEAGDLDEVDHQVSHMMLKAWVAFAQSGNPNHPGMPRWDAFDAGSGKHFEFGSSPAMGQGWRAGQLSFLEAFYESQEAAEAAVPLAV